MRSTALYDNYGLYRNFQSLLMESFDKSLLRGHGVIPCQCECDIEMIMNEKKEKGTGWITNSCLVTASGHALAADPTP